MLPGCTGSQNLGNTLGRITNITRFADCRGFQSGEGRVEWREHVLLLASNQMTLIAFKKCEKLQRSICSSYLPSGSRKTSFLTREKLIITIMKGLIINNFSHNWNDVDEKVSILEPSVAIGFVEVFFREKILWLQKTVCS